MTTKGLTIWTCDRCFKEWRGDEGKVPPGWHQVGTGPLNKDIGVDLCDDCDRKFFKWIHDGEPA